MKLREIGERVLAVIMMLCIVSGIILMMCESEDWNTQITTLLTGFVLFCVGVIPGIAISLMARRKENFYEGNFGGSESRKQRTYYIGTPRHRA